MESNVVKNRDIIEAGIKLNVTTEVLASTFLVYHQFQKCVDETAYDPILAAAASMVISGKLNEQIIDITDIINVFFSIAHKDESLLTKDDIRYKDIETSLGKMEIIIGRTIKFSPNHKLAHHYLLYFWKAILLWLDPQQKALDYDLIDKSFKLLSDFYIVKRVLIYPPEHIAVAVLNLAMQCFSIELKFKDTDFSWQKALCGDLTEQKLKSITEDILDMYVT